VSEASKIKSWIDRRQAGKEVRKVPRFTGRMDNLIKVSDGSQVRAWSPLSHNPANSYGLVAVVKDDQPGGKQECDDHSNTN
jgi:hypothetical protein